VIPGFEESTAVLVRFRLPLEIRHRLLVGHLPEVRVKLPDAPEVPRRLEADDLVGLLLEFVDGVRRTDRYCEDDTIGVTSCFLRQALTVDPVATPSSTTTTVSSVRSGSA